MCCRPTRICGILLWVVSGIAATAMPRAAAPEAASGPPVTLAVADFRGADGETGSFLAEMLMTALNQSANLRLVECGEVRQACSALKLDATGLRDPRQVRRLGESIGIDDLVVGSYRESDQRLIVNVYLLNAASGRPEPGCAGSVEGSSKELLSLTSNLARQIHDRVIERAPKRTERAPETAPRETTVSPARETESPEGLVSEGDLAGLVARLAREFGVGSAPLVTVQRPQTPVTRLRAVAAFVKLLVSPGDLAVMRSPRDGMPTDVAQVPAWGLPYVAAAVEQGLLAPDEPLQAKETASWAFVQELVARLPSVGRAPEYPASSERVSADRASFRRAATEWAYTGVIVDARDFDVQRAMGPRIVDEDGNVLYPDPRRSPSPDALQSAGMVSYASDERAVRRAGGHPLLVRAIDVVGPAREDVVVSREAAEQILQAERRWRCLTRRAVGILIPPHD
jgi:TolB-like protein